MKRISIFLLFAILLIISGCKASQNTDIKSAIKNSSGLVISNGGIKWSEDKNALPFEAVIRKISFKVKQPDVPFKVTNKAANIIKAPFEFIQLIYANKVKGYQLILAESNSKNNTITAGKKGPKLKDGTQTWNQGNQTVSALYWRKNGLTFSMLSNKIEGGKFVPLYDISELSEIANKINEKE